MAFQELTPAQITASILALNDYETLNYKLSGDDGSNYRVTKTPTGLIWTIGGTSVFEGAGVGDSFLKFTKTFADFQPNNTQTGSIVLGQLPAGAVVVSVKIKPSIAFKTLAPFVNFYANLNLTLQTGGNLYIGGAVDLLFVSDTSGMFTAGANGTQIPNNTIASDIVAVINVGDDNNLAVIDNLNAGAVDIWVTYKILI